MTRLELISVDFFFKPPVRAQAAIAPDGTRVTFVVPWQDRLNIRVAPLDGNGKSRRVTADQTRSIQSFSCTDYPRWLLYLQDTGGDENWPVFQIDLDDREAVAVDLTAFSGAMSYYELLPDKPGKAIVGKMHDDLIDYVEWATGKGYADRARVAILGVSDGGYAALVGVTFTPDVFVAAIDYVGISDLSNFVRTLPEIARPHLANSWHLFVGNPDDPEQLKDMLARSAITKIDQITTLLLVGHPGRQ